MLISTGKFTSKLMKTLPSITTELVNYRFRPRPKVTYIKPSTPDQLEHLDTPIAGFELKMAISRLVLPAKSVVPVHVHWLKEKVYVQQKGILHVLMFIVDQAKWFQIRPHSHLLIPAYCPHGLCYPGTTGSHTLVIRSNQDSADIEWEPDADKLCGK